MLRSEIGQHGIGEFILKQVRGPFFPSCQLPLHFLRMFSLARDQFTGGSQAARSAIIFAGAD